ncbi:hypothetical protein K504DRAFT_106250 [Pleomassaria siparia CBS 279.74]|uniref:C2H2-type domain-containing protein n=1 Tax=Pleomassaria siparia CBS 279.74 TaxID=1314801 RepID=A0A6G1JXQ7_9PLEO|nr:hypothetical protein K504DRAFT_106250 [Pleomassaria siparia CBS 279.74]
MRLEKTHTEPYHCGTCDVTIRSSKDINKDVKRHKRSKRHQKLGLEQDTNDAAAQPGGTQGLTCPVEWCAKKMPEKYNMDRHIREQHPGLLVEK